MKNPNQKIIDSGLLPDVSKIEDNLSKLLDRKVNPVTVPLRYKSIVGLVNNSVSLSKKEKRVIIFDICSNKFSDKVISALTDKLLDEIVTMEKLAEED